jgi:hypothetical protein
VVSAVKKGKDSLQSCPGGPQVDLYAFKFRFGKILGQVLFGPSPAVKKGLAWDVCGPCLPVVLFAGGPVCRWSCLPVVSRGMPDLLGRLRLADDWPPSCGLGQVVCSGRQFAP